MSRMDVLIVSASRVECLKRMINSFLDKVKTIGDFRFLIHEDMVFVNQSERVLDYIQELKIFDVVVVDHPWVGQGKTLAKMIPKINSSLFWYLEDDWEFERKIPLDDIIDIMNQNEDINQIWFNYRKVKAKVEGKSGFDRVPRKVIGPRRMKEYIICLEDDWRFMPGVWRTDWVQKRCHWFGEREDRAHGYFQGKLKGYLDEKKWLAFSKDNPDMEYSLWVRNTKNKNVDFIKKNIGSYVWGHIDDYRYVNHTGGQLGMQKWQRVKGDGGPARGRSFTKEFNRWGKHPDVPYPLPDPPCTGYGIPSR